MINEHEFAQKFHITSFPQSKSPGPINFDIAYYETVDGEVCLTWDTLHGIGWTTHVMFVKHEDIPEVAEGLMSIYNQHRREQSAVDTGRQTA